MLELEIPALLVSNPSVCLIKFGHSFDRKQFVAAFLERKQSMVDYEGVLWLLLM